MASAGRIEEIKESALGEISGAETTDDLEAVRVRYLGRSAELTELKKSIGSLPAEERKEVGKGVNVASGEIERKLQARHGELAVTEQEAKLREEAVDVTLPGVTRERGSLHPLYVSWTT